MEVFEIRKPRYNEQICPVPHWHFVNRGFTVCCEIPAAVPLRLCLKETMQVQAVNFSILFVAGSIIYYDR